MKKALLALALVMAISPLTFAQKTNSPAEKSSKKNKKKHHKTGMKAHSSHY